MEIEGEAALAARRGEDSDARGESSYHSGRNVKSKASDDLKPAVRERGSKLRPPLSARHAKSHRRKLGDSLCKARKHDKASSSGETSVVLARGVQPKTAVEHPAAEATSEVREQLSGGDEHFSVDRSRPDTMSNTNKLATQEEVKGSKTKLPSEHLPSAGHSRASASSVTQSLLVICRQHDVMDDTTEELSLSKEQANYLEEVVHGKQRDKLVVSSSPASTKDRKPVCETTVFADQSSCSISSDLRRTCHSADTSGNYRPDGITVCLVAFVCAAFVAIVILLIRITGTRGWHSVAFTSGAWIKELESQCNSTDCLSAVKAIGAAMDVSADPCTNFYAFVCGHWSPSAPSARKAINSGPTDRNVSYMASLRNEHVRAVNESLWRVTAGSAPYDEQVNRMGQVYMSCLAFFTERPLNLLNAWRASKIFTDLWLQAKTFQESFFLAVTHLLRFRLLSALHVLYDGQMVDISPGTAILQHISAQFRHVIVTCAVKTLLAGDNHDNSGPRRPPHACESNGDDSPPFEKLIADAIVKMDDTISSLAASASIAPVVVPLNNLDSSQWNWTAVLAGQASIQLMAVPLTARVTNLDGVRGILESLSGQEHPLVTKIYLMLVPLAQLFALEERVRLHRHVPEDDVKYEVCITTLETMFGEVYRFWIIAELFGSEAVADVKRILTGVLAQSNMQLEISQGAVLDYGKMIAALYGIPMFARGNDTDPTIMVNYGPDFIANAVLFLASGGRPVRPLLDFDALSTSWSDGEVVERLLIPDFYYAQLAEPVLNYGTVGYYLARLAFQAGSPKQQSQYNSSGWNLIEHTRCLASYAREASRLEMAGDEPWWLDTVQVRWASEASFRASLLRDSRVAQERALAELFYLRLGHTFCAVPGDGSGRTGAATALRVAAMTLPTFARAFGCPVMVGIGC